MKYLVVVVVASLVHDGLGWPVDSYCGCIETASIETVEPISTTTFIPSDNHLIEKCDEFCGKPSHPVSHFVLTETETLVNCSCHHDLSIFDCAEEDGVPLVGVHCKTVMNQLNHIKLRPPPFRTLTRDIDFAAASNSSNSTEVSSPIQVADGHKAFGIMALVLGLACVLVLIVLLAKVWLDHRKQTAENTKLRTAATIASFASKLSSSGSPTVTPSPSGLSLNGPRFNQDPQHLVYERH